MSKDTHIYVTGLTTDLYNEFQKYLNEIKKFSKLKNIKKLQQHEGNLIGLSILLSSKKKAKILMGKINKEEKFKEKIKVSLEKPKNYFKPQNNQGTKNITQSDNSNRFYNPYTFIPSLLRRKDLTGFAADSDPIKLGLVHDQLVPELWSGMIKVKAKIVTPLVLLDINNQDINNQDTEHKTFSCKSLPESSQVRGMLRSAYEAITNSRLHGFDKDAHIELLGFRMRPYEALGLVPARVIRDENGSLKIELMTGVSHIGNNGRPIGGIMYAAWLPRYKKYSARYKEIEPDKHESKEALAFAKKGTTNKLPQHGQKVFFQYEQRSHGRFYYLKVTKIMPATSSTPPKGFNLGYVCITGPNIPQKHYERVFFNDGPTKVLSIPKEVKDRYEALIKDYQELHKDERPPKDGSWEKKMQKYLGHNPGETGFSRHIWDRSARSLKEGDLVYVKVNKEVNDGYILKSIYPVMISRDIYPNSPSDLLPEELKHPKDRNSLSPADRLFGWIAREKQDGKATNLAYRGRIKIELPIQPRPTMEKFSTPLPLAILGEPKPAQGGFYVAKDKNGTPPNNTKNKLEKGYCNPQIKGLRGRKFYWHYNSLPQDYWQPFPQDLTADSKNKEYIRAGEKRKGNQNCSITGWIKPGKEFSFNIHIINLTDEEVGAILWLLSLPEGHCFKLGYGKPLGFGSIRLSILNPNQLNIAKGESWKSSYYNNLFDTDFPSISSEEQKTLIDKFKNAMTTAYDNEDFTTLPFIAGFLQVTKGPPKKYPIHYPRLNDSDEIFKWFVENDGNRGNGLCLPHVNDPDGSLPTTFDQHKHKGRRKR